MCCLRDVITERILYCFHLLTKLDTRLCATQQSCPYLKSKSLLSFYDTKWQSHIHEWTQ